MTQYAEPTMQMVDDTFTDITAKRVLRMALQSGQYGIVTDHDERNYIVQHAEGTFEVTIKRRHK